MRWGAGRAPPTGWRSPAPWSKHLHDHVGARTLFATHYHELADLAETLPRLGVFRWRWPSGTTARFSCIGSRRGASTTAMACRWRAWRDCPPASPSARRRCSSSTSMANAGSPSRPAPYAPATPLDGAVSLSPQRELALRLAAANIAAMTPMEAINALFALQQRALMALRGSGEGV